MLLLTSVISLPFNVTDHVWQGLYDLFAIVGAEQHLMFALQYLRSSLTVPLYFERREKIESRRDDRVEELEQRSKRITRISVAIQLASLPVAGLLQFLLFHYAPEN